MRFSLALHWCGWLTLGGLVFMLGIRFDTNLAYQLIGLGILLVGVGAHMWLLKNRGAE